MQCIFCLSNDFTIHFHRGEQSSQSQTSLLISTTQWPIRWLGWNPRTHRFLSSAEFFHVRDFINVFFLKSFIVWSHSLVKTELCKIVCFSCLTSDHVRHRDSYLLHYIDQDNNFRSTVILRSEPGPMQDLGKETVINYVYWLPRQIMHLLAFLFNLSVSELLLSVTQIMHFVRTSPPQEI